MTTSQRVAHLLFALPRPLSPVSHRLMHDAIRDLYEQLRTEEACREYAHWNDTDDYPGWVEEPVAEADDTDKVLGDYLRGR